MKSQLLINKYRNFFIDLFLQEYLFTYTLVELNVLVLSLYVMINITIFLDILKEKCSKNL